METGSILYSLKVWITSVVFAPLIYLIIEACVGKYYQTDFTSFLNNQIAMYAGLVIFGGIFSFFTWVVFALVIFGISICFPSSQQLKYVLAVVGVLLTGGTFAVFLPETLNINGDFFYLMVANCLCIAAGACFYKLKIAPELGTTAN